MSPRTITSNTLFSAEGQQLGGGSMWRKRMEWQINPKLRQYTLEAGSCMAIVRQDLVQWWTAQIVRAGVAIEHDSFEALTDAQAWCITRLGELAAMDECE